MSTDIESDGPIPGPHSMLSLGSAAFAATGALLATFEATLETLPGAAGHPETMSWWANQPDAWAAARVDPRPPAEVMADYDAWLRALPGRPVFVGYPAAYDFMFVHWYQVRFVGTSPFGPVALDVRTYAMAALHREFSDCGRVRLPARFNGEDVHSHRALDDAVEQGNLFIRLLHENTAGADHEGTDG